MANSSIIAKAKNKIVRELIKDPAIIEAIDCTDDNRHVGESLYGTHIFDYAQNPNTINTVQTFITIQVHIPQERYDTKSVFVNPTVEIRIISHDGHMRVDNVPKVRQNRNDYLSYLIDEKLNGRDDFGIGRLRLISNIEGTIQKDYVFRQLIFKAMDFNDSLCDR